MVGDIVLDMGCSHTMVRKELVDEEKTLEGRAVTASTLCSRGYSAVSPSSGGAGVGWGGHSG